MKPLRGYEALRRHRWSHSGFTYFLTLCTVNRETGLTNATIAEAIRTQAMACETDAHWRIRAGVIMPDHVHLLVVLIGALPLGRIVARLKAMTRADLSSGHALRWQGNYYEHRLRPDESVEDVLRYLFLNPYRAGLVAVTESYPWYWIHADDGAWFTPQLNDQRPFPEWLG